MPASSSSSEISEQNQMKNANKSLFQGVNQNGNLNKRIDCFTLR